MYNLSVEMIIDLRSKFHSKANNPLLLPARNLYTVIIITMSVITIQIKSYIDCDW